MPHPHRRHWANVYQMNASCPEWQPHGCGLVFNCTAFLLSPDRSYCPFVILCLYTCSAFFLEGPRPPTTSIFTCPPHSSKWMPVNPSRHSTNVFALRTHQVCRVNGSQIRCIHRTMLHQHLLSSCCVPAQGAHPSKASRTQGWEESKRRGMQRGQSRLSRGDGAGADPQRIDHRDEMLYLLASV